MLVDIGYILKLLSCMICLHLVFERTRKIGIADVGMTGFCLMFLDILEHYRLQQIGLIVMFFAIVVYCLKRFRRGLKVTFINLFFCILLIEYFYCVFFILLFSLGVRNADIRSLILDCILFFLSFFVFPFCNMELVTKSMERKSKMVWIDVVVCACIFAVFRCGVYTNRVELHQQLAGLLPTLISVQALIFLFQKYRQRYYEREEQLLAYETYNKSYQELIRTIRAKQHDFQNHISALYGLHYTCSSYEELVEKQREYCENVKEDHYFNKLLTEGNSIIIGFLYGKFSHARELNIDVEYSVNLEGMNLQIPDFQLIEIMGNLLDNAIEALSQMPENRRKLSFQLVCQNQNILRVRNICEYIPYDRLEKLFEMDESTKGAGRGVGLYRTKELCDANKLDIMCQNRQIGEENWLEFAIKIH